METTQKPKHSRLIVTPDGRWFMIRVFDRMTEQGNAAYLKYKREKHTTTTNIPAEVRAAQKQLMAAWDAYLGEGIEKHIQSVIYI
jgi:hypothetical protein